MKALVGAFTQEKALVGAFSVIVQPVVEPMVRFTALIMMMMMVMLMTLTMPMPMMSGWVSDGLHHGAADQVHPHPRPPAAGEHAPRPHVVLNLPPRRGQYSTVQYGTVQC